MRAGVLQRMLTSGAIVLALAMPVRAETLEQALIEAYQNNPQLNSQRAVVRETDETVPQALSGYKPTVRVTGTVGQEYTSVLTKTVPQNTINPVTAPTGLPTYLRNGIGYSPGYRESAPAGLAVSLDSGCRSATFRPAVPRDRLRQRRRYSSRSGRRRKEKIAECSPWAPRRERLFWRASFGSECSGEIISSLRLVVA